MNKNDITTDEQVHSAAMALTSTFMTEQWRGSHVYKVGDVDRFKMFAILNPGKSRLTLKTDSDEIANLLIHAGVAERNAHMPRAGWVMLKLDHLSLDDVKERLERSHLLTSAGLPTQSRKKFGLN